MAAIIAFLMKSLGLTKVQAKTAILALGAAVVAFHIAWVCGVLGFIGLPAPFAREASLDRLTVVVSALKTSIDSDHKEYLEDRIFREVQVRCNNPVGSPANLYAAQTLHQLIVRYERAGWGEPRVPDCAEAN
jgi:hypothetical protein